MERVPTLKDCAEIYIANRQIKKSTADSYRTALRSVCQDWLDMPIDELTKGMVVDRHKSHSQHSPGQADLCMRVLRCVLRWGAEYWSSGEEPLIKSIPTDRLTILKLWHKPNRKINDRIELEDLGRWFHSVRKLSHTQRDYLYFLVATGCRRNEGAMVQFEDIDFERGLVRIHCAGDGTKTTAEHVLPLSDWLLEMLWLRRAGHESGYGWVFPNQWNSGPLTSPYRAIKTVTTETGIKFSPHTLRRTFALLATHPDVGADELVLKACLNHALTGVTWKHYLKPDPERLRPTIQGVSDLLLRLAGCDWADTATRAL